MIIKKYILIIILCLIDQIYPQEIKSKISDTLNRKDYDYLFERIEDAADDKIKQLYYLQYFLNKAKREKNSEEIVNGYKNYLHYSPERLKIVYADSMIYAAKKSLDNALIGSSYLSKGIVYYARKEHKNALDNYLIADDFISKTNDKYLIYKVKYNIASIKYFLGFYDEAISLFIECIDYYKDENTRAYLNSLHLLGLCYNRIGNYGFCSEINKKGIEEGVRLSNIEMQNYFIHSEGINQYFKNNYAEAIKKINYSIPSIRENKDFGNESVGYFYIGKSYWNLHKPEMALPYFVKVDKIFDSKGYMRPDLRQNYELLLKYYKSKKDFQKQLYYTDKLLKADSILDNKFIYLSGRVRKIYDTKLLLADKQRIENLFNKRKYNDLIFIGVITAMFIVLLFFVYRHFKIKSIYKLRYEEYMQNNKISYKDAVNIVPKGIEEISEDKVAEILIKLEKFEHDKKYLEKDLNSIKLAAAFGCNPKYLSKVIYHYRGKKFVKYISDLKIDHLITLMKEDKKIRKYNNTALADEVGFSTTQKFSQAFYAKTGFPTSYFVEEINKSSE
ncbi:AraC family transcriptional regulator [Flavobacterium pectinovorum]|uniref:AraC family transcriptional regulator n=1 Tax=Flavobacterium pectinovorum TaxID=29533 RepID=UPI001FAB43F5|nr:AraC family transcriptional regulator [Flavobacterium pectinovorum]MCI9843630.1 AraC family transcriptional regulator [Flavobacterium pectinovorum]